MLTVSPGYTIYDDIANDTIRLVISYSLPVEGIIWLWRPN